MQKLRRPERIAIVTRTASSLLGHLFTTSLASRCSQIRSQIALNGPRRKISPRAVSLSAPLFGVMECFVHRSVHNTGTGHRLIAIASHRQPRRSRFGLAGSDRHRADDRGRPPFCPGRLHQLRR